MKNNPTPQSLYPSFPSFDAIVKKAHTIEFWDFKTAPSRSDFGSHIKKLILTEGMMDTMKVYDIIQKVALSTIPTRSPKTLNLKALAHEYLSYEMKPVFCSCPIHELMNHGCQCGGA